MAVIGEYHSEISIAVARPLNLEQIPQISYGSTSGLLSDKTRFPSFLRTVPQDDHQAHAIVQILNKYNWTWVGVVATDGEYGRYAVERLRHHAAKHGICFAYINFLPELHFDNMLEDSIAETVKNITETEKVSVIVSFAKADHMKCIFNRSLQNDGGKHKVWIASDNWSQSVDVMERLPKWMLEDVGTVLGITLKSGNTSRFEQFLKNQTEYFNLNKSNSFIREFLNMTSDSNNGSNTTLTDKINQLITMTYPYAVFSIELAVKAIAATVKDLCINQEFDIATLQPKEFRDALKNAKFSLDAKKYTFNEHGDLDSGYDFILWRSSSNKIMVDMYSNIGYYDIKTKTMTFNTHINNFHDQIKEVISKCSTCFPGQMKMMPSMGFPVCCYKCKNCSENEYSDTIDAAKCNKCDTNTEYSAEGSSNCSKREDLFLKWKDPYHIVLLTFTSLGALLTLLVGIIFLAHWNTPVVRSSVGPICVILLFCLLCTFLSVVLFGAQPKDWKCQTRQVLFGLSFTLSITCILVKSFKIIMTFEFDPVTQDSLKKIYKPYIIIPLCMAGQVVIVTIWLVHKAPKTASKPFNRHRLLYCEENLYPAFGAMLAYIGLLVIICFVLAFKGRKLPQCYNDAKFITFSMLVYFIAWIIFGPVYYNVADQYQSAVQMVVIVISAYGILFCQFLIKCYVILFKQKQNTEAVFRSNVRNFANQDVEREQAGGIQNSALSVESLPSPVSLQPMTDQQLSTNSTMGPSSSTPVSDT